MKKKKMLIITCSVVIVALVASLLLFFRNKEADEKNANYVVKVGLIDDKSPDRTLTVLRNDKKIEFKEIHYMDDMYLCSWENPVAYFGDLKGETELKVILKNDKTVIAKIDEGDIK